MKRKNLQKCVALLMAAVISTCAACGQEAASQQTEESQQTAAGTKSGQEAVPNEEVVDLKWIQVGSGMPSNYEAWKKNLDSYLEEKIGVHLNVEVISWGDWNARRSVIVNTNEPYDILFTDFTTYVSDIDLGAYYDLTEIVKTASPRLYSMILQDYWKAAEVNGKLYAVPTLKDSSMTQYFIWDKAMLDQYEIDASDMHTLDSMTEALAEIHEGENAPSFILSNNGLISMLNTYDQMSTGLPAIGVRYNDAEGKVVATMEQEDIMEQLKILHEWYQAGIINSDAATHPEDNAAKPCSVGQGWSLAAKSTWGPNMGIEAEAVQWYETIVSNDTVRGSMSCISSSCKYPEKALQLLELVNTDSYVRDALYYGLEGENFAYTDDKRVTKLNEDWSMAGYTQGTFFNVTQLEGEEVNQWDEVKELNENAKPSVLLGFTFDTAEVADELANCTEIYQRYKSEILTGTKDPEQEVPAMMEEMRAAGFDAIVEAAQKQVDAFMGK